MPLTDTKNERTEAARADRSLIESELRDAGIEVKGIYCRCPVHDDGNASAELWQGKDGAWRVKCFGCQFYGDVFDIRAKRSGRQLDDVLREFTALGQTPGIIIGPIKTTITSQQPAAVVSEPKEQRNLRTFPTIEALRNHAASGGYTVQETNLYRAGPHTRIDMVTFRMVDANGKKTFRQGHERNPGEFVLTAPEKPWPLFNRTALETTEWVVVVEGEKCVRALAALGIPATTSPGGAGKAAYCDWTPLTGKAVYVWPDADAVGLKHGREVVEILRRLPGTDIVWVNPLNLPVKSEGTDAVDVLATVEGDEAKKALIDSVLAESESIDETDELATRIADCIAGRYATVEFPWKSLSDMSRALRPGTVTLLCGDPGATKSFMLIEAVLHWIGEGVPVSLFELEEDSAYWQTRALAILDGNGQLTEPEWMQANAAATKAAYAKHKAALAKLARRLTTSPENSVSTKDMIAWMEQQAKDGARIIAIDPITAIEPARKETFLEDQSFMLAAKVVARQFGCSLIFVTHPRKTGKTRSPLEDMAGGAAYPRFAQNVLWLKTHRPRLDVKIYTTMGNMGMQCNRTVNIAKSRNGRGAGRDIAFEFSGDSLRFRELGLVTGEE